MKCPICNAWTRVLRTQGTLRRRECANLHRFTTREVVLDPTGPSSTSMRMDGGMSTEPNDAALPWKRKTLAKPSGKEKA